MKNIVLSSFVALSAVFGAYSMVSPALAAAADAGKPPVKPQVENYGNWEVRCFPVKSPSPCDIRFATVRKQTGQRVSDVSIAYLPAQNRYVMQVGVPLGVALGNGATIVTDAYTSPKLVFRRCDRAGCFVEMPIGGDFINGLQHASNPDAHIYVTTIQGQRIALPLSLKGFNDAHDEMVKQAKDRVNGS